MSSAIEQKKRIVEEITEKLKKSQTTVIVDYRGLNVAEITELRKQLREAGVEFKVYKNTLMRRAAEKAELSGLNEFLTGPNAVAFSEHDPVMPAKILNDFAKKNEKLEIKAGVVEGRLVSISEIKALAELPPREGLLSMLLSVLQAPIRNFALAVKAVADQKEGQSA
ncbi:MAG: 50S ribosomal protein L10 [Caldibacillus debilis]|jgi:large subunit ribosomal protein L10|uniref:Large ribosomal subunit protein uL10 n=1 Tax=Caldibacillus debilis TaxID=301148 RepID=A0A3E0K9A0_9BACI|nr:50S ribosomal protein L10 [Caldibacillus debilis]MBY6270699.1 50S ribosomal protein L10 [Bacillaceae bacterium]OUM90571.1 MAG: 50S ribosomal protein L10 [Caldibacillus debilis]REJ19272.1 MAG: 50S ribosomal protein L10 [Caldibacillus debilis]REJ31483.1 MAG: 50S ribosomal protein L10 [Caldibacillus debilis]